MGTTGSLTEGTQCRGDQRWFWTQPPGFRPRSTLTAYFWQVLYGVCFLVVWDNNSTSLLGQWWGLINVYERWKSPSPSPPCHPHHPSDLFVPSLSEIQCPPNFHPASFSISIYFILGNHFSYTVIMKLQYYETRIPTYILVLGRKTPLFSVFSAVQWIRSCSRSTPEWNKSPKTKGQEKWTWVKALLASRYWFVTLQPLTQR